MFLSSYSPLFAILAYTNRSSVRTWRVLVAVAVVACLGLVWVMWANRSEKGPRLTVAHSKPQDGDVLAYIATYLVPFFGVDLTKADGAVVFCAFLAVLMTVYVNSNMLFVNPLLSIFGYHAFEITDEGDHTYTLIAHRQDVDPGTTLAPAQISRYLRLEVRHDR
jgi:hypothetical protein